MMTDSLYFHRTEYAQKLVDNLQNGIIHAFTLFAPRRMGKTQFLLKDVMPLAETKQMNVFYFSFMSSQEHIQSLFKTALVQFSQNILQSKKAITFVGGITKIDILGIGIEREASGVQPLDDIVSLMGAIAQDNRPSLLLLDEVQELARMKNTDDIVRTLRTGLDMYQDKVKVIFTGSSTHGLRVMFNNQKAPFFHFAHALDFPHLDKRFTDFLADTYHARTQQSIDKQRLYEVFEKLHYTPMYMRAVIQDMILNPQLPLEEAVQMCLNQLDIETGEINQWSNMTALERLILTDIHTSVEFSPYSAQTLQRYADALGVERISSSGVQGAMRRMEKHDWISRSGRGQWVINNPLLKTWLEENS